MGPDVDGYFLPQLPMSVYAAGGRHAVPLIIGSNAQEQSGPKSEALRPAVQTAFGGNADRALAYYGLTAGGDGDTDPLYGSASQQLWADARQRCGSVQEAIWHAATRSPVYQYQFDHAIAGRPATQHSAEVPYVFGDLLPGGFLGGPFVAADRKIADDLQAYWVNFARRGDPNGAGLPRWPRFDPRQRGFLEFTDHGPTAAAGLRRQICDLYMDSIGREIKGS
jgi:para-nitrobenzyl esterase